MPIMHAFMLSMKDYSDVIFMMISDEFGAHYSAFINLCISYRVVGLMRCAVAHTDQMVLSHFRLTRPCKVQSLGVV